MPIRRMNPKFQVFTQNCSQSALNTEKQALQVISVKGKCRNKTIDATAMENSMAVPYHMIQQLLLRGIDPREVKTDLVFTHPCL